MRRDRNRAEGQSHLSFAHQLWVSIVTPCLSHENKISCSMTIAYFSIKIDILAWKGGDILDTCIGLFPVLWGLLGKQFFTIGLLNFFFYHVWWEQISFCTICWTNFFVVDKKNPNHSPPGIQWSAPNSTWRPPWCLLRDVIWAPPECNTTSESPDDVIEQLLQAGAQEFATWLKFNQSVKFRYFMKSVIMRKFWHSEADIKVCTVSLDG